jgi:flavin reductase (DIM6/NTAB) family NADH-FMN oxidoreductase RutF
MNKIKIGNKNYLYPNPVILVGANVNGKPNYLNVSYCGIVNRVPAMISISLNKSHYTCKGIKENKAFSINIPSLEMLEITDYCGIVSGKEVDKSKFFNTFYGSYENIPMIEECPINMECKVIHELDLGGSNITFIGQVIESYSEEKYLTKGIPNLRKINPILLSIYEFNYYSVGKEVGKAWNIGKDVRIETMVDKIDDKLI